MLSQAELDKIVHEGSILNQLDHPNIVRFRLVSPPFDLGVQFRETDEHLYIGMELLTGGSLSDLLERRIQ